MPVSSRKIPFILFASFVLVLTGCSKNVVLDNPGNDNVSFLIDGENKYEVLANSSENINLSPGQHQVQVIVNDEVIGDTTFNLKESGIVHSGQSNYVVWRQLYGMQKDRKTLLNEEWVEFDSVKAFGDLKIFPKNRLFIEKTWDYGLDKELPDAKSLYISSDFVVESKVFRTKDFIEKYKSMKED